MAWPKGVPTRFVEPLGDDVPCPRGHVGRFTRYGDGKRKCNECARIWQKNRRVRAILTESARERGAA